MLPKLVDLQGSAIIGRGIGRYGSSQLAAASFNADGSLNPLPEIQYLGGAVVHATPQLDIYAYGGQEKILNADWTPVTGTGYGTMGADNSGCYFIGGACTGKVHDDWELTAGFWDKIYQGAFGSVRFGLQYVYVQDDLFPGTGSSGGNLPNAGMANVHYSDQMAYASFRYYPFDPAPAAPVVSKY